MFDGATYTEHAREQMQRRGISEDVVIGVLTNPESVTPVRGGRVVARGIVRYGALRDEYMLRVFVDIDRIPPEIVTMYCTSKIAKYRRLQ